MPSVQGDYGTSSLRLKTFSRINSSDRIRRQAAQWVRPPGESRNIKLN
jgi:hypothetical protein